MQENQADNLPRVVVLRLRRLALLHLLFIAVFVAGLLLFALLSRISALFPVGLALFGLGATSFFLAPPVVSFLYARKLNAWKAFWFATAAGVVFSFGGAFLGFSILAVFSRSCSDVVGTYPKECTAVGVIALAIALLPNFLPSILSYLMFRKRISLSSANSDS